ncbi:MAG: hemolysin family protein [Anaerolineales bacterium]|jgi:putative hemolysin
MFFDFLLILILILANGFFAASEIAVVSAREARLQARADGGNQHAVRALKLRRKPGVFLATVQIGITLVATLASAVGGVEAARGLAPLLAKNAWLAPYAEQIALGTVVLIISYASLLLGELVPKRLAIRQPERWAMSVSGIFEFLSRIAAWPVRFLLFSADFVLRLFGEPSADEEKTSPEEIEFLVRLGTDQGIFLPVQERMIARIFDYADRATRDVMTPRTEIVGLEVETPLDVAMQVAKESGFSRFPVYRANIDNILGYVHIKDLIWADSKVGLEEITRQMAFIPEGASLPRAFQLLTKAGKHMGIVLDEYSGTDGVITLENVLEVIVGEIEDEHSPVADVPKRGKQGEWCISGGTAIIEVGELLEINFDPGGVYNTLAGFMMSELGKIPKEGDTVIYQNYKFVVEAMERFRIQMVRIQSFKQHNKEPDLQ